MTTVYMLWHGGSGYAVPSNHDVESFDTIREAMEDFRSRTNNSYYPCCYADTPEHGGPEAWIMYSHPYDADGDVYPDELWSFGPRGGLRRVQA